jgi:hypothetical protein
VVIVSGMYINHSDWIQFEIDYAKSIGKPILVITPWSGERTPISVQLVADKTVAWNTSSIVQGIREIAR